MKNKKVEYFNVIYGIDIETSTIFFKNGNSYRLHDADYINIRNKNDILPYDTDMDSQCSFMYSFVMMSLNMNYGIPDYSDKTLGRTYKELDNILEDISNKYYKKDKNKILLIYIHNLSYEFSFFINNLKFFKNANIFATDNNKPIKVSCKNIEFRCSYALLGKSIDMLGMDINMHKLEYDYEKLRTPISRLSTKDIEYNSRDVEIMLKSIYKFFKDKGYSNLKYIKLTKTSSTRYDYKRNDNVNKIISTVDKNKKVINKRLLSDCIIKNDWVKATSENQLKFWESIFKGGLVYSNPKYCGRILDNIISFDFSSDYPFQILFRKFPKGFREIKDKNYKKRLLDNAISHIEKEGVDIYIKDKMSDNFIQGIIKIKNLRAKYDFYPLMEQSLLTKPKNYIEGVVLNGKIKDMYIECGIKFSYVDLITLVLFYDFEIVDIEYLENSTKIDYMHPYVINCVKDSGTKKVLYKKFKKIVENNNEYKKYNTEEIDDSYIVENINKCNSYSEQLDFISTELLLAKGSLNSNYGINVQHQLHDYYYYDYIDRVFKVESGDFDIDYKNKFLETSYCEGMYISAYAQGSILYFVYKFINKKVDCIYIDTDSFKIKNSDYLKVKDVIDNYNKYVLENMLNLGYNFDFGTLDCEGILQHFVTLGSKCYMYLHNDRITTKISGFPRASEKFDKLYNYFNKNFNTLVDNCFHFNCYFTPRVVQKFCANYDYKKYDLNINGYKDTLYSGCVLKPVGMFLRNTQSPIWRQYKTTVENYYNLKINDNDTVIDIDMLQ